METKHERQVRELIAKITRLRGSMPQSMWSAMERRVCAQTSVAVATDALLKLAAEKEVSDAKK
jgi:hypothetical protein